MNTLKNWLTKIIFKNNTSYCRMSYICDTKRAVMNIFVIENTPEEVAKSHTDRHIVKMPTELAQMISFAYYHDDIWDSDVNPLLMEFNKAHDKHPCSIWIRESAENFMYACELGIELVQEYRFRYKTNKHQRALDIFTYGMLNTPEFDKWEQTKYALAMPEEFKVECPIESYRNYYREGKKHLHNWTNRVMPLWINE